MARTHADHTPALWTSLFPARDPKVNRCDFIFDPDARHYDWLVVYEDLPFLPGERRANRIEKLACARKNTLFITTEPYSIKIYGRHYLRQFGHVMSAQPTQIIDHPNHIQQTPPLRWYYGRPFGDGIYLDVDTMGAFVPSKKYNISTVCSDKQMSHTFKKRYQFTQYIKNNLGDKLTWFGRGIRPISDKAEAMDDYRYHIAIENHIASHHWTEKIADCFLAGCLPFYHGPPNIFDYFPEASLIPIDTNHPQTTLEIIKKAMKDKAYTKALPAITEARNRVLNDYNIMNIVAKTVETKHANANITKGEICGRHIFRKEHPVLAISDALHRTKHRPR